MPGEMIANTVMERMLGLSCQQSSPDSIFCEAKTPVRGYCIHGQYNIAESVWFLWVQQDKNHSWRLWMTRRQTAIESSGSQDSASNLCACSMLNIIIRRYVLLIENIRKVCRCAAFAHDSDPHLHNSIKIFLNNRVRNLPQARR